MHSETSQRPTDEFSPGSIKLAHNVGSNLSDDDLLFLKQIGLRWVRLNYGTGDPHVDKVRAVVERYREYGLEVFSASHFVYRSTRLQLGLPGRDGDIETFRTFLQSVGKLGIKVTIYDFHPGNTYTTSHVERRGYTARQFDLDDFRTKVEEQRYDRVYSADDMWDNYIYFMKATLPVAQESGVVMALHPDDPPLAMMNGVAKLFGHYDGYKRAEEIAKGISGQDANWGLRLCVGTWAEGGDHLGKDVFGMIEDFGGRGKIYDVDFRNVSSPLPRFVESLLDDGYLDMYRVMKALRQVNYTGIVVPDHVPQFVGDQQRRAGIAYLISYMRALIRRANEEVG